MVLEIAVTPSVPPYIYSGDFKPDDLGNSEKVVQELSEAFADLQPATLEQVIPSLHRIQRIFGNQSFLPAKRLTGNAKIDLESFCQAPPEIVAQVENVIRCLSIAEIVLVQHFIDESPLSKKRGREAIEDIDTRTAIVTTIVWQHWKPWEHHNVGLVDSLIKQVMGNLSFTDLTIIRDTRQRRETDFTFQDDVAGDESLGRTWSWIAHEDSEQNRIAPAAEKVYLEREIETEFLELAKGTLIQELVLGDSIETVAARHSMSVPFARKKLHEALTKISRAGVEEFHWGRSTLNRLEANVLPDTHQDSDQTLPTDYETWSWFADNQTDLIQLMGIIDSLPVIQRKCILYRFGYLNPEISNTTKWAAANDMSEKLYRTTLNKAFELIHGKLRKPLSLKKSIAEVVTGASQFTVEQNSQGRRVDENSNRFIRLLELSRNGTFPAGSLSSREKDIVDTIGAIYESLSRVPSIPELAQAVGLKYTEVIGLVTALLSYDFSQPRYATQDSQIRIDFSRYQLISWTRKNKDKPEIMRQLSALTPLQLAAYKFSCQLVGGYFPTFDQIQKHLIEQGFEMTENFKGSHYSDEAWKTLSGIPNIEKIYQYLKAQNLDRQKTKQDCVKIAVLKRIETGQAIGKGAQVIIAKELEVSEATVNLTLKQIREEAEKS